MNTEIHSHQNAEIIQCLKLLRNMIDEEVPPEALVDVGSHLADLLAKHSVRESNPAAYQELRALVVGVFSIAARALRDEGRAPADILEDIDGSLDRASLVLTLASAYHPGEAA